MLIMVEEHMAMVNHLYTMSVRFRLLLFSQIQNIREITHRLIACALLNLFANSILVDIGGVKSK